MPAKSSLNVSLTPELEKFVKQRVATGQYQTASEVVREGLRLLERQERERREVFRLLKAKLTRASRQADRGEFVDPERVLKEVEARKRERAGRA